MAGVMMPQKRSGGTAGALGNIGTVAGGVVGGMYGGPGGALAGSQAGGAIGQGVGQVFGSKSTPQAVGGASQAAQGYQGMQGAMQRRMGQAPQSELTAAEEALKQMPEDQQRRYGQTISNALRYERAQGGY
jgi:hypothetical protein